MSSILNYPASVENSVNGVRLPRNEVVETSQTIESPSEDSDQNKEDSSREIKPEVKISLSGPLSNIYSRALMLAFGKKEEPLSTESQANDAIMADILYQNTSESTSAFLEAHPDVNIDYAVYATGPQLVNIQNLTKDIDNVTLLKTQPNIREVVVSIESIPNQYSALLEDVCVGKGIKVVYSANRVIDYIKHKS